MKAEEILENLLDSDRSIDSIIEAMEEYAKDQIEKDRERVIAKALKWVEHDCDNCACGCRGDWIVNNPGEIRDLPIILE